MKGRSALPRLAFALGLLTVVAGVAAAVWGRPLLAELSYFSVRRVEVVGSRWLAPDSMLQLAAIGRQRSVWEDYTIEERRLVEHPLIEEVRIKRAGLHGLRIVIREVEPIALVGVPDLRAVRGDGTLLPIDPAGAALDLPVLAAAGQLSDDSTRLADGPALGALTVFARVRELDPGLAAIVSDFELLGTEGLGARLVMSQPVEQLALPVGVNEQLVRRVRATLADLRKRGVDGGEIEARFADQIVVRRGRQ